MVDHYHLRPAYPLEVFLLLQELLVDEPRVVLDVGCGPGTITRALLDAAERIDAVDISPAMLEQAKALPGGDSPKIRWLSSSCAHLFGRAHLDLLRVKVLHAV